MLTNKKRSYILFYIRKYIQINFIVFPNAYVSSNSIFKNIKNIKYKKHSTVLITKHFAKTFYIAIFLKVHIFFRTICNAYNSLKKTRLCNNKHKELDVVNMMLL